MSTKFVRMGTVIGLVVLCLFALVIVNKSAGAAPSTPEATLPAKPVALSGYDISIFARGTTAYYNPDSIEVAGKYVYIAYQNTTAKDGTDNKTSTIIQYTKEGRVVRSFKVPGHNDGLRFNPYTHLLWATSNEDGNPRIMTINPSTGVIIQYQVPKTPHGGGYDDLAFFNGIAFIAASNPTLNAAGINVFPAVDKVELKNGKAILTPILQGNTTATDLTTNQQVTLNLTDPDSMTVDNQGNLVLDSQADSELISLHNPGTLKQTVTRLPVGTQVDDTIWTPAKEGSMLVVDAKANTTYKVTIDKTDFKPGTIYTEAPSDSMVASFVGTVDPKTGTISPAIIGLGSPTGLAFLPGEE